MNTQRLIKISFYLFLIPFLFLSAQQKESLLYDLRQQKEFLKEESRLDPLLRFPDSSEEGDFEDINLKTQADDLSKTASKITGLDAPPFSQVKRRTKKPFYMRLFVFFKTHFVLCDAYPVRSNENLDSFLLDMGPLSGLSEEETFLSETDPYYRDTSDSGEIF
jgi:hypothetical protein